MRTRNLLLVGFLLLAACGGSLEPVTPAQEGLTFLFFYTDNWTPWAKAEPVVNGLTQSFPGKIEVRRLNVDSQDGGRYFQYYGLPGHPGFILLNPQGEVLWKGFGEQAALEIEDQVRQALEQPWPVKWMC